MEHNYQEKVVQQLDSEQDSRCSYHVTHQEKPVCGNSLDGQHAIV
jgi:hypothetical protein